ncbi:hypothetical protein HAX54_022564 [Datura stramonium]|uniref:Uncharacterized protein n=1 Tax=Datura stramonium TaxID=4076 RepID=A0ABS8UX02_DATST|nr:hypothetical protein [Datura stramonium]
MSPLVMSFSPCECLLARSFNKVAYCLDKVESSPNKRHPVLSHRRRCFAHSKDLYELLLCAVESELDRHRYTAQHFIQGLHLGIAVPIYGSRSVTCAVQWPTRHDDMCAPTVFNKRSQSKAGQHHLRIPRVQTLCLSPKPKGPTENEFNDEPKGEKRQNCHGLAN